MTTEESMGWQMCPKCGGQGYVWLPPDLPFIATITSDGKPYICDVCNGMKIINIATGRPPEIIDAGEYLKECIEKAAPNLSKIKDVDGELEEIKEERLCCDCKNRLLDYSRHPCRICSENRDMWEPKIE